MDLTEAEEFDEAGGQNMHSHTQKKNKKKNAHTHAHAHAHAHTRTHTHTQVLEGVSVAMDLAEAEEFDEAGVVTLDVMPLNGVGHCFTILSRPAGAFSTGECDLALSLSPLSLLLSRECMEVAGECMEVADCLGALLHDSVAASWGVLDGCVSLCVCLLSLSISLSLFLSLDRSVLNFL
jgi:hypothetical protein